MARMIAGVDEAGRGPLAGPVVAAAVILGDVPIAGLDDSKKLSPKRRAALQRLITDSCIVGVGVASVTEIDQLNILQATLLAMFRAVATLAAQPDYVLVDGNRLPDWHYPSRAVIGGDALHPCISAASIVAKETRDRMMIAAASEFPDYGWIRNKGYGAPEHIAAIKRFGLTPLHRALFVRKIIGGVLPFGSEPAFGDVRDQPGKVSGRAR